MNAEQPVAGTTVTTATDDGASELAVTSGPQDSLEATAAPGDLLALPADASLSQYIGAWAKRVRSGDSGVLPVIVGLIVIVIIFQTQSSVFLSAANLTNLLTQGAPFVMLGMAEVFVLLLGEIDLSIGYSGAVGAAVMTILAYQPINFGWGLAIAAGLATTAGIGFLQGQLITRLRLPSFVVTLAGLLFWEGFLIWIINNQSPSNGGSIRILNTVIHNIIYGTVSPTVSWIAMVVGVAVFAILTLRRDRRRAASGLVAPPIRLTAIKIAGMAAAGIVLVAICNTNRGVPGGFVIRGVPWVVPIVLAFVVCWTFLLNRTRFGRYVYAIGGNSEAARRAGINVRRTRVLAFTLAGFTAAAGMIIYASRLGSMSSDVDGGQIVLYAVAAAVIGGASLFGGRGKMVHALLGGIVIATIYNGMGLLDLSSAVQYMVTALVLLAAVTVDAVSRRGSTAS
ncbi:MAG: ABC transporter permease [Solirubrobacteraceae bacterium]